LSAIQDLFDGNLLTASTEYISALPDYDLPVAATEANEFVFVAGQINGRLVERMRGF
jgi:hypothetical protein